jgi:hypothetical protein
LVVVHEGNDEECDVEDDDEDEDEAESCGDSLILGVVVLIVGCSSSWYPKKVEVELDVETEGGKKEAEFLFLLFW